MRKKYKKKSKIKTLIILVSLLIILFLIFLLIQNMFMFRDGLRSLSHVNDIKKSIKNNDTKDYYTTGWLDVYNTSLNMPVFYMRQSFDGSTKIEKFSWSYNDGKFHNIIIINGHNIMNLGIPKKSNKNFNRFEELVSFLYPDFASKHRYIQYTVDGKDYIYKIFSVGILNGYNIDTLPINGTFPKKMSKIIKMFNDNSIYDYDINVDSYDDIIVLSTCTRINGKDGLYDDMVVVGKRVKNRLSINSKIKKTTRYKAIDNVLRGENDES